MRVVRCILTVLMLTIAQMLWAQSSAEGALQDLYSAMSDLDDFDQDGWEDAYEVLCMMAESPQNINEATLDELLQVPLLSGSQAAAIIHYRTLYGNIHDMAELSLIEAMDKPRLILLNAIFYAQVGDGDKAKGHNGHSKLLVTLNVPTYEREGFKDGTYEGGRLSHSLRYTYSNSHYQMALTAAQDAGEPFFCGTNKKGWDFYTGFVRIKDIGLLKNLVAGHYQMSLGMGLILNNGYKPSRTSLMMTPQNSVTILRGHASKQESNYMQGVAATLALPGNTLGKILSVTAFVSHRPLDATMKFDEDAAENGTVTTILTSGYHRTESEIARRGATRQSVVGGSLTMDKRPLRMALNVMHVMMRDSLKPFNGQQYRMYYPMGKNFTLGSLSYAYFSPRLQIAGETAVSPKAVGNDAGGGVALATMNDVNWKIGNDWTLTALQRYYNYRFQSPLGRSFGDVSNVQDESGVYVGLSTTAVPRLTLSAYVDCAYHPWFRYGYDGASRSWDTYFNAIYVREPYTITMRYRYREQTVCLNGNVLPTYNDEAGGQHSMRTTLKYVRGKWMAMSQVYGTCIPSSSDWGYMLSQGGGMELSCLSLWASFAYFHTSSYASRLYLTDRNLTYCSTTSMLYGHGFRGNIIAQVKIKKDVTASVCSNISKYFDRKQLSSGHQLIDASSQTDIMVQLGWKF